MVAELRTVMVIDQRERSRRVLAIGFPGFGGQPLANKLANRFTASGKLPCPTITVELFEQLVFEIQLMAQAGNEAVIPLLDREILANGGEVEHGQLREHVSAHDDVRDVDVLLH